jgi:glycosyltransferase involved in cell wall biosynthesis
MNKEILISVCIITYNHEAFIAECLEGAVKQKLNFPYEIIISDDKSSDRTLEICREYAEKYPTFIRLKENDANLGMTKNYTSTILSSLGKYIAICEGDDYWTDPLKLKKQVDFLESNPDYAFCYHHVKIVQEGAIMNHKLEMNENQPDTSTIAEVLKKSIWPHINSVVFRNGAMRNDVSSWFNKCISADWALLSLITGHKKIKYFKETMSVYRQHGSGIWSQNSRIRNVLNTLKTANILNENIVKPRDKKHIYWPIHYSYLELIKYYKLINPIKAFYYILKSKALDLKYRFIFNK